MSLSSLTLTRSLQSGCLLYMSVILIVVITAADLRLAGSYEEQQLPAVNTADQQLLIRAIQAVSGIVRD
jgi:hypothetical protein